MTDNLCPDCVKKLCAELGEDMGFTDAGEFYDAFRTGFVTDWIDELSKDKIDNGRLHYLIALYCNHDFEDYFKYTVEWLLKTDPRCVNEEKFELFLISKRGVDFREPQIDFLSFFDQKQIK